MAVAILFAVGLVVLFVVADQIVQGKAVVSGDEINARVGQPAVVAVQIARSGQAKAEAADLSGVAFPKAPHGVAIGRVPFGPQNRKVADLITARSEIPWLGDQFDLRNDRVLMDDIEKRAEPVDVVELARQRRRRDRSESRRRASP